MQLGVPAPLTGLQVPFAVEPKVTEQASHEFAHAVSQQNPSTQKVELHWVPSEQATPLASRTPPQLPLTQATPLLQSVAALVHVTGQFAPLPLHR